MISFLSLGLLVGCYNTLTVPAPKDNLQNDIIIKAPEKFFSSLRNEDFTLTWFALTEGSKKVIAKQVRGAYVSSTKKDISAAEIYSDFENGGPLSQAYWRAFKEECPPELALEQSRWELGQVKGDYAEIILRYRKSQNPAILKVYKEGSAWKFGLVESFWSRK